MNGSHTAGGQPYSTSPVFDEQSLPQALQEEHTTKKDVWGLLRVLEGEVELVFLDGSETLRVTPDNPAPIPPRSPHYVQVSGPMSMQVEFYRQRPQVR